MAAAEAAAVAEAVVVDNLEMKTVSSTRVDGATAKVDLEDPRAAAAAAEAEAEASTHMACLARCHLPNVVWIFLEDQGRM